MLHLSGWKNKYGNYNTRLTEANDGMAFTTTGTEDKKGNKKKEITCYKCKKWATSPTSVKRMRDFESIK